MPFFTSLKPRVSVCSRRFTVMAIVTYVLLAGLYSGLHARFHPEILGITASKALAVVLMDFLFVKLGCYFLNISVRPFLSFPTPCSPATGKHQPDPRPACVRRVQVCRVSPPSLAART